MLVKWSLHFRSERSGSVSPSGYLPESFIEEIKVGAKSSTSNTTGNGQIHQLQQPTTKQEQTTTKQEQLTSKQEQQRGKQEQTTNKQQLTSKQQQQTDKQEQLTNEQQSKQQLTRKQHEDVMQEDPSKQQQLRQTITEKLEQHQKTTENQQKHDPVSNHSKQTSANSVDDNGPAQLSMVEPVGNGDSDMTDAWQSEKVHQDVKAEVVEDDIRTSASERTDGVTSPMSSDSVASSDLVHYKRSVSDENFDSFQNGDAELDEMSSPISLSSRNLSRLTPRKRAISVDVLPSTDISKVPVFYEQEQPFPARRRSQTVLGDPKRKAPPIPVDKSPSTRSKRSVSSHSSLGDLRRPVQSSVASAPGFNTSGMAYYGKFDILGVLRVRLRGVSIPDHTTELMEIPQPQPLKGRSISVSAITAAEATHGIYCVFTINGGNTSAKSGTCKILPYRPVLWEENEKEKLFFTNHSRQLFILCRKVPLKKKAKSKLSSEVCVGASVMKIIEINPTLLQQNTVDYTSTDGLQWYNKTLPLQPKGEIELSVSFEGV